MPEDFTIEKCRLCKHFSSETWATRINPSEPADCNHPVASRFATLPTFPFTNGCRHFESVIRPNVT